MKISKSKHENHENIYSKVSEVQTKKNFLRALGATVPWCHRGAIKNANTRMLWERRHEAPQGKMPMAAGSVFLIGLLLGGGGQGGSLF